MCFSNVFFLFTVERPAYAFVREAHMQFGCTKHSDVFAAHFAACDCIYNFCEFKCILRIPNQNYFEHSVVHFDHFRLQLYNSRNYSRVADRAKDKLVLNRFSVNFKNSLYRTDFFECIKPFRKISKKTEHVFAFCEVE